MMNGRVIEHAGMEAWIRESESRTEESFLIVQPSPFAILARGLNRVKNDHGDTDRVVRTVIDRRDFRDAIDGAEIH